MVNIGKVTRCFTAEDLTDLYELLEEGDLLEFQRTGYAHWAVYCYSRDENGTRKYYVINRAVPVNADRKALALASRSTQILGKNLGEIIKNEICNVLGPDRVRINNEYDKKWRPKEKQEILARAQQALVSKEFATKYDLFTNNCEHFANCCRYGKHVSRQVKDGVAKVVSSTAGAVVPIAARQTALFVLPIMGVTVTGPVGMAVSLATAGVSLAIAAIPPIVHGVECLMKK